MEEDQWDVMAMRWRIWESWVERGMGVKILARVEAERSSGDVIGSGKGVCRWCVDGFFLGLLRAYDTREKLRQTPPFEEINGTARNAIIMYFM